jgi:formylglycine-generating enzyme required for sulfatase activity
VRRIFVVAFLLSGCGQILGVTDWVVDDASTDSPLGDAQNDTMNDSPSSGDSGVVCKSPRAGGMDGVLVQNEFCIDSTETPYALYDVFLNDPATNTTGQTPECAWNTTFAQPYDPYQNDSQRAQRPMVNIDWCDAFAFCKYWGKHLCGARGDGGPLDFDAQPAKTSQWYTACTNGTSQQYPYGQVYDASACNVGAATSSQGSLDLVGNPATCQGGVPGLFDMSGNAQEYENDCEHTADAAADRCHFRGGTYFFPPGSVTCAAIGGGNDNFRSEIGPYNAIRCCWEP